MAAHTLVQRVLACLAIAGATLAVSWRPVVPLSVGWVNVTNGWLGHVAITSQVCPFQRVTSRGVMVEGICVRSSPDGFAQVILPGWESAWLAPEQIDQGLIDEFRRQWDRAQAIVAACQTVSSGTTWLAPDKNDGGVCHLKL